MPSPPTILLCGGDINASNLPIATSGSNAMIPVNGKPVIGWILEDLLEKQVEQVVLVTQENNQQLEDFVQWAFQGRLRVHFARLATKGNIIQSLQAGLKKIEGSGPLTVQLGDTLINAPLPEAENYVLVSDKYDDPRNWCLAQTDQNGHILEYFDKMNVTRHELVALTGLYHFSDAAALSRSCEAALEQGGRELSAVLSLYNRLNPIQAIFTSNWFDFGHMPHFLLAKRALLQPRYFNDIQIEEVSGILHKTSRRIAKLQDEYDWYLNLPEALKVLTPRILGKKEESNTFTILQEYYGYPNLAELYLFGNLDLEIWKTTVHNLMRAHLRLKNFKGLVEPADAWHIYWEKTEERITELVEDDPFFRTLVALDLIYWNGNRLKNLPLLRENIRSRCEFLAASVEGAVIHGDFCLSNILYDVNNQLVRLIDPRGSFGKKGIYGDPRYDIAKLRHSLCGGYDFIVADLFTVSILGKGHFETTRCSGELYNDLAIYFDREIESAGYDLQEIMFIEALLFLSMIPLHKDKPKRQIMMYLRAVELFNHAVGNLEENPINLDTIP
ncbi:MAG: sugar phosphate nucleotidyltransferase [Saprospiraceae bacterium]